MGPWTLESLLAGCGGMSTSTPTPASSAKQPQPRALLSAPLYNTFWPLCTRYTARYEGCCLHALTQRRLLHACQVNVLLPAPIDSLLSGKAAVAMAHEYMYMLP